MLTCVLSTSTLTLSKQQGQHTMQVTMLYTRRGSQDGFTVERFVEGNTYDMSDTLARSFVRDGQAYIAGSVPPARVISPIEAALTAMGGAA